ncbi:MAG: DUF1580 domain-containing protein [Pirellulaceae bacterium]
MIDIDTDRLIELSEVPAYLEKKTGKRPNLATIYRWRQRGIAGIYLETVLVGGKPFTSISALNSFFTQSQLAKQGKLSNATKEGLKRARLIRERQLETEAKELGI